MNLGVDRPFRPDGARRRQTCERQRPHPCGRGVCPGAKADEAEGCGRRIVGAEDLGEHRAEGRDQLRPLHRDPDLMPAGRQSRQGARPPRHDAEPEGRHGDRDVAARRQGRRRAEPSRSASRRRASLQAGVARHRRTPRRIEGEVRAFTDAVTKAKPAGAKGNYIKKVSLTRTMGPAEADPASLSGRRSWNPDSGAKRLIVTRIPRRKVGFRKPARLPTSCPRCRRSE